MPQEGSEDLVGVLCVTRAPGAPRTGNHNIQAWDNNNKALIETPRPISISRYVGDLPICIVPPEQPIVFRRIRKLLISCVY